jgi:hypothetical protein
MTNANTVKKISAELISKKINTDRKGSTFLLLKMKDDEEIKDIYVFSSNVPKNRWDKLVEKKWYDFQVEMSSQLAGKLLKFYSKD